MPVAVVLLLAALAALGALGFSEDLRRGLRRRRVRDAWARGASARYDPGRERRAEARAQELLRSVVGEEAYAMYRELGFLEIRGRGGRYGYLVYPHRSIVAYEESSGELLSEYCVGFPDRGEGDADGRLPDSDDVLAKWMALQGDEERLIADANMHLPGRHVDPAQVRRDLYRLRQWKGRRRAMPAPPVAAH